MSIAIKEAKKGYNNVHPNPKVGVVITINNKLISNVTANEISNKEDLKKLLVDQIENRVRWREGVIYMINKGINQFIEIGPGKILSGLVKRINKDVKINSINNENDINNLKI